MLSIARLVSACAALVLVTGCAHNIVITPAQVAKAQAETAQKSVGFYISAADKEKEVVTPGGGGDKVSYKPYQDLESPLYFTLQRVYAQVEPLKTLEGASGKTLNFIVVPEISTDSSSSSAFTWPPTDFTVTLNVTAQDASGKKLWTESVTGKGQASFSEFKSDLPLAAKRASRDALDQLETALRKRENLN